MKEIFKRISQNIKVTNKYDFPAGNMFWARSEAVHQLINLINIMIFYNFKLSNRD